MLACHGHTVISVSLCHPDLNPVEKIWGIMKTGIAAKNVTFKLRDVQQLAEQNVAAVTMEGWAAVCRHIKAVEEEYMFFFYILIEHAPLTWGNTTCCWYSN